MAAIAITPANVLASSAATILRQYNFGATVAQGQSVYLDSNNLWQLTVATTSAVTAGSTNKTGIALNAGSAGQPATVCIADPAFTPGGALTAGVAVIVGTTPGAINPVTDVASTWFTTVLGIPISVTQMILNPLPGGMAHA